MTPHIADRGPRSIRVYTTNDDDTRLVATMRLADIGTADDVLRAHGWHRVTPWATSDDRPAGHTVALIERAR